jgi:hypothetical protein
MGRRRIAQEPGGDKTPDAEEAAKARNDGSVGWDRWDGMGRDESVGESSWLPPSRGFLCFTRFYACGGVAERQDETDHSRKMKLLKHKRRKRSGKERNSAWER